jgi:ribose/xylose/arabinose/galactoside ABC-type transport system permease subunit
MLRIEKALWASPSAQRLKGNLAQHWADYALAVLFILMVIYAITSKEAFLKERNLTNIARQIVTNGLISLGMLVVILTGGIDLSVGSVVALAAILAAGLQSDAPIGVAIAVALVAGVAVGLFNGVLIAYFKLAPFIVTLATMGGVRGLVYVYSDTPQSPAYPQFRKTLSAFVEGIPVTAIIMLMCYVLVWIFLNRTTIGRAIYAIGGNAEAVRLSGINVEWHTILAYIICGFFSALAGVLLAARLGISQPNVGSGYELDAIAATVIGGATLGGGSGGAIGAFGGVLTLGLIDNLLNLYKVQSYYQQILKGGIILAAVLARRRSL